MEEDFRECRRQAGRRPAIRPLAQHPPRAEQSQAAANPTAIRHKRRTITPEHRLRPAPPDLAICGRCARIVCISGIMETYRIILLRHAYRVEAVQPNGPKRVMRTWQTEEAAVSHLKGASGGDRTIRRCSPARREGLAWLISKPPVMTSIVPARPETLATGAVRQAGTRASLASVPGGGTTARSSMTLPIRRTTKQRAVTS